MFKDTNVATFITELEAGLNNVKENVKKDLLAAEPKIQDDALRMIPYDTGASADSYYSEITEDNGDIVMLVGFDREGRLRDYLPMIHELVPAEWDPSFNDFYTPKDFYRADHQPQIGFLRKSLWNNWNELQGKLKVKYK